jgi:transposase
MYNTPMKKTIDLRKIPSGKLQKIKDKAMKLRDNGISNKEVTQKLNLDPSVVSRWYSKYLKNFRQPQELLKKGRKEGTHTKLTINQEKIIIEMLQEHKGLLDKDLVQKIIKEQYKMKIPLTTVGDYLKKWGVNSSLIKKFENEFVEKVGIDDFQSTKQEIMRRDGIIIWITIMNYEIEKGINISSISTRAAKNKLIKKFYRNQIQPLDLIEFINQIATSFNKHLYVIFSTKSIEFVDSNYRFENKKKITFINDA